MQTLDDIAKGTDVFILQNMGPIEDLNTLSYESKLLIKVSGFKKLVPAWPAEQQGLVVGTRHCLHILLLVFAARQA